MLLNVQLGYMQSALPAEAPEQGEGFDAILQDVQRIILPGELCCPLSGACMSAPELKYLSLSLSGAFRV